MNYTETVEMKIEFSEIMVEQKRLYKGLRFTSVEIRHHGFTSGGLDAAGNCCLNDGLWHIRLDIIDAASGVTACEFVESYVSDAKKIATLAKKALAKAKVAKDKAVRYASAVNQACR